MHLAEIWTPLRRPERCGARETEKMFPMSSLVYFLLSTVLHAAACVIAILYVTVSFISGLLVPKARPTAANGTSEHPVQSNEEGSGRNPAGMTTPQGINLRWITSCWAAFLAPALATSPSSRPCLQDAAASILEVCAIVDCPSFHVA